jgi:hypothetical protein
MKTRVIQDEPDEPTEDQVVSAAGDGGSGDSE